MSNSSLFLIAMLFDVDGVGGRAAGPAGAARSRCRRSRTAPPACARSTATSRSTGTSAPARCCSRYRGSTASSCCRPGSRPASARTTSASIAARAARAASSSSSASVRACCWCSRTSRSARAAPTCSSASRWRTRSRSRCCGASPSPAESERPGARRCDRLLPARRARRRRRPAARQLPRRPHAQRVLPAEHQGLPEEHRSRRHAHVRQRGRGAAAAAAAARRRARRRSATGAAAAVAAASAAACSRGSVGSVTPTADAVTLREHVSFVELPDGNFTPRIDDPRAGYGGLSFVDYSAPIGEPMQFRYMRRHRLREEGPGGGDERAGQADPVLGGFGRARGREEGAHRRRDVVEPGVRGRRLPQRVQGRRAARRTPTRWTSATT